MIANMHNTQRVVELEPLDKAIDFGIANAVL
jgi:hypothetical protein